MATVTYLKERTDVNLWLDLQLCDSQSCCSGKFTNTFWPIRWLRDVIMTEIFISDSFFSLHRYHFYNVLNSCEMWISVLVCLFHVSGCTTEENSHTHTKLYCYVSTKIGASGLCFSEHTAADKHGCDEIQDPSATTQHMTPSHENSPVCLFQLQFLCIFVLVFHVSSKQKSGFVLTFVELFQCPLPDAYLLMFCFFFLFHTWPYSCNMSTLDKHSWWD